MRDIVQTANCERNYMQQQYDECRNECQRLESENENLMTELSQVCDEVIALHDQVLFMIYFVSSLLFSWTRLWEALKWSNI